MKNQFNRSHRFNNNARSTRSNTSQQITRFTILDSSGPLGKLRGTALQLAEKYQAGAKDAQSQGDVILFQTCQQYADHYLRLQAIALENEQQKATQPQEQPSQETSIEVTETPQADSNEPQDIQPIVEKKTQTRHKKNDSLSMPIEALQEKSEQTEPLE